MSNILRKYKDIYLVQHTKCTISRPADYAKWYWILSPGVLYGIGHTISTVIMLEVVITQSASRDDSKPTVWINVGSQWYS